MKKFYLYFILFFIVSLVSFSSFSQSLVSGVVVDGSSNEPLIGANVSIKGTTIGTFSGLDGSFSLAADVTSSSAVLISYVGYEDIEVPAGADLGVIKLTSLNISLSEVRITADYGLDRKTPTTFSNVSTQYLEEYGGTQEVPELLKFT